MLDVCKLTKLYLGLRRSDIPDFAMWKAETGFDRECVSSNPVTSHVGDVGLRLRSPGDRSVTELFEGPPGDSAD
jgi:hypothetical protein